MRRVGLIGGNAIGRYSVADVVWKEIFRITKEKASFEFFPLNSELVVEKVVNGMLLEGHYCGFNVALPWKRVAASIASIRSETVMKTGFANCLFVSGGKTLADNTDGIGCLASLDKNFKKMIILGAGGAGTVLAYEAFKQGKLVHVYDINRSSLRRIENSYSSWRGGGKLFFYSSKNIRSLPSVEVVVNATPVGKSNNKTKLETVTDLPISPELLKKIGHHAVAVEMNYLPMETEFLVQAKQLGNKIIPGLNMLVYQAIFSYDLFFRGKFPERLVGQLINRLQKVV